MTLVDQLKRDEGLRLHVYADTVGKLTIGYGRDLTDDGISAGEAELLLANDIATASRLLSESYPWTDALDDVRRSALINMCFNMGLAGLSTFRMFLLACQRGNWAEASVQMLASKWAEEVGPRAHRLALQLTTGTMQ